MVYVLVMMNKINKMNKMIWICSKAVQKINKDKRVSTLYLISTWILVEQNNA